MFKLFKHTSKETITTLATTGLGLGIYHGANSFFSPKPKDLLPSPSYDGQQQLKPSKS